MPTKIGGLRLSFDTVLERAERAAQDRTDYMVERSEIQPLVADGEFKIGVRGKVFRPTDHCLQQLSTRAGVKSASILREMRGWKRGRNDAEMMVTIAENIATLRLIRFSAYGHMVTVRHVLCSLTSMLQ